MQLPGLKYKVVVSNHPELLDKSTFPTPAAYAKENAYLKALDVSHRLHQSQTPYDLIIGADTVVILDNTILEKPTSEGHAYEMLSSLSGREHTVITGVAVLYKGAKKKLVFHEETKVKFGELGEELMWGYIKSGEPMDKAGAYGIQGKGGGMVERIEGCYFTVMGLPMFRLAGVVKQIYEGEWKSGG